MATDNFKDFITKLNIEILSEGITERNISSINETLKSIINNNTIINEDIILFITVLNNFTEQLPYSTILLVDIINKTYIFQNLICGNQASSSIETPKTKEESRCCAPATKINADKEKGFLEGAKDIYVGAIIPASRIGLDSTEVANSVDMYHKTVDHKDYKKIIVTYKHLADGNLEVSDIIEIEEPNHDDIFTNILGKKFNLMQKNEEVNESDL